MAQIFHCKQGGLRIKAMTLIELLIVLLILSLLGTLAYPSYSAHVRKGHRLQAQTDLLTIQLELESRYSLTFEYDTSIVTGGSCDFCASDVNRYRLSIDNRDTYTIQAIPQTGTGQHLEPCGTLTLAANGVALPVECW